ncbi:MAG TPA: ATP-binding protein [Terriglobales bacterium]|nr:ATP-binding protein [Terriglobales bacterium]
MKPGIGTLAILGVAVVTAVVIGVMSAVILRTHQTALVDQLKRSADQLSETIASSTYHDMLENRRDAVHREIVTIGRQRGIEKVRLFNAAGTIMFSSSEAEIGRALDKKAEACYACHAAGQPLQRLTMHARARIYRAPDGHRVLGMIRPIDNERSCWSADCHAHTRDASVLGVLDVNLSMAAADRQIAHDQRQLLLLAVLAIAASSALLWWLSRRWVLAPVDALIAGTRRVAAGDFTTEVLATTAKELGDLARAFNEMTRRLSEAHRQLTQADKLASVGRLAAGVAHEINNPLTGVLTYASFLEKRVPPESELREDLAVIVRETKRCREIVRGLLDFARQTPPRRQPTDLNEVIRRAITIVTNQLALARVGVTLELADDLGTLPADANQIQQVVVNLLLNAADAIAGSDAAAGGSILVRSRRVEVPPRGNVTIRSATCPRGCDLLDSDARLGGLAMIRVLRRAGDLETVVHLDPVYGRGQHRAAEPSEEGVVASHFCPVCRARLDRPERTCALCGAPMFAVHVAPLGDAEWCARQGCPGARWDAMDALGPQPYAEIVVEDTGRGITPEETSRIFEPFFTTKGTRGTGLGLAVTWGIVEGHGGSIGVESEPGHGTRFTVRLPYRVPESPADAAADRAAGATERAPAPSAPPESAPAPAPPHRGTEPGARS